eukprot:4532577-Pleurochrysis_carterae.AAC.1
MLRMMTVLYTFSTRPSACSCPPPRFVFVRLGFFHCMFTFLSLRVACLSWTGFCRRSAASRRRSSEYVLSPPSPLSVCLALSQHFSRIRALAWDGPSLPAHKRTRVRTRSRR